jgi:GNAT superfamily N-acetyltransferase
MAHRILAGRDQPNDHGGLQDDPKGLRALDLISLRPPETDLRACRIGAPWQEPRGGSLLLETHRGPLVDCQLIHTGKNFFVKETGIGADEVVTYRLAREPDLARAGISMEEAVMATNLSLPKRNRWSEVAITIDAIRAFTAVSVAELQPNDQAPFNHLVSVARSPDPGSDFDRQTAQARSNFADDNKGNFDLLNYFRQRGFGGVMLSNQDQVVAHAFYQRHAGNVHVFSVFVAPHHRNKQIGTALTVFLSRVLARDSNGGDMIFGKGSNQAMNALCDNLNRCAFELRITQRSNQPHIFALPSPTPRAIVNPAPSLHPPTNWRIPTITEEDFRTAENLK